ncbi:LacI family DNA-binding transcriptional regulator [Streptomyces antimycoticus]|uniref:LacI family DNA-binding transcriptional regulator n=1 Tax=Streptomyces antimycoticus TaxID=68175 RepID=UPI0036B9C290
MRRTACATPARGEEGARRRRVPITDVGTAAGVSTSTVSRVLNGTARGRTPNGRAGCTVRSPTGLSPQCRCPGPGARRGRRHRRARARPVQPVLSGCSDIRPGGTPAARPSAPPARRAPAPRPGRPPPRPGRPPPRPGRPPPRVPRRVTPPGPPRPRRPARRPAPAPRRRRRTAVHPLHHGFPSA